MTSFGTEVVVVVDALVEALVAAEALGAGGTMPPGATGVEGPPQAASSPGATVEPTKARRRTSSRYLGRETRIEGRV